MTSDWSDADTYLDPCWLWLPEKAKGEWDVEKASGDEMRIVQFIARAISFCARGCDLLMLPVSCREYGQRAIDRYWEITKAECV